MFSRRSLPLLRACLTQRCVAKTAICRQGEGQFAFLSFYGTITGHFSPMCFVVQNSPSCGRSSRLFRNRRKRAHTSGVGIGGGREVGWGRGVRDH